jgi:hypothetical protein
MGSRLVWAAKLIRASAAFNMCQTKLPGTLKETMKWQTMAALLAHELDVIRPSAMPLEQFGETLGDVMDALLQLNAESGEELDQAVEHFLNCGHWPTLSAPECTLLALRLEYAVRLAQEYAILPKFSSVAGPIPPKDATDVLHWLLTFAWHQEGITQIPHALSSLFMTVQA